MSTQGLKNATEQSTLENKPGSRRRGAAGRAAALRRAPSDSDCSGETASLSADSGERRPAPPAPRSGKTRSRRRGSEWEVLEGLKDGQRFERRPEVFNGYLHKKRKWPLKGWHKRFFVVDGGILVYARSPSDVARGRLHGSLDVGLSVISAKPRRRRIDIDADEFIYHLRAKTPEVFRTWLNVLRAHRLYRQHLLTFGAREPAPKIHAPLDELPPTDTSSRISQTSLQSCSSVSTLPGSPRALAPSATFCVSARRGLDERSRNTLKHWLSHKSSELFPTNELLGESDNALKPGSLCSMCCINKRIQNNNLQKDPYCSKDDSRTHSGYQKCHTKKGPEINLHFHKKKDKYPVQNSQTACSNNITINSSFLGEYTINSCTRSSKLSHISVTKNPLLSLHSFCKAKSPMFFGENAQATMFFFGRRKRNCSSPEEQQWAMRRSKKSTNVTKYKNNSVEPLLKRPLSKCMLLGRYQSGSKNKMEANRSIICDLLQDVVARNEDETVKMDKSVQDVLIKNNKSVQDTMSPSDYDTIAEKVLITLFDFNSRHPNMDISSNQSAFGEVKFYVQKAVKELYTVQLSQSRSQPVKFLFKSLLEYWLKNTESSSLKETQKESRYVETQSNHCFTKDKQVSSEYIQSSTKETQVFENHIRQAGREKTPRYNLPKPPKKINNDDIRPLCKPLEKMETESYEKERRIQELERLLKNTVYICETVRSAQSRDEDIKITKTLIQNLDKYQKKTVQSSNREISDSSAEIPRIQETINRLISDTDLPPEMAKEFLNVYLDMLLQKSSMSETSTSLSSEASKPSRNMGDGLPFGDVQAEAVQKKVSKSITTTTFDKLDKPSFDGDDQNKNPSIDPGQLYLKEILDKLTSMFTKVQKIDANTQQNVKDVNLEEKKTPIFNEDVKAEKTSETRDFIYENKEINSVVIDLCKYDLDHIAMRNDCASKGMLSITIKLKEKPKEFRECKRKNLNLKFSNHQLKPMQGKPIPWPVHLPASASTQDNTGVKHIIKMNNPYIDCDPSHPTDKSELRPYLSTSNATSKANNQISKDSEKSFGMSFKSSNNYSRDLSSSTTSTHAHDKAQCYILSSLRKGVHEANSNETKRLRLKELNESVKSRARAQDKLRRNTDHGLPVFTNPPPRIIDEKFILLLLENLMLLSKNIPGIYKDINGLYLKLRKRHEKIIKNSSFAPGLSLLGKIYDEESCQNMHRAMFDEVTQFDPTSFSDGKHEGMKTAVQIAVNTSILLHGIPDVLDKALSAYKVCNHLTNFEVQTEPDIENIPIKYNTSVTKLHIDKSIEAQTSFERTDGHEDKLLASKKRAISILNWSKKFLKESSIATAINSLFEGDSLGNSVPLTKTDLKISAEGIPTCRKNLLLKAREEFIREMKIFSDSCKVSTHSQTENRVSRHQKCIDRSFRVYKVLTKNSFVMGRSESISDSNVASSTDKSDDMKTLYQCSSNPSFSSGLISPTVPPIRGPQAGFVSGTPGGRLASWIIESGGPLENASRELGQAQLSVQQLQRLLDTLELQQQLHHDTDVSLEGASPNVKKDRRKFGLRKKKSSTKCASVELAPPALDVTGSHVALSTLTAPPSPGGGASSMPNSAASLPIACAAARPQSLPGAEALATGGPASITSLTPDHQLREDFTVLAKDLVASLKTVVSTLVCERGRLRAAMDTADTPVAPGGAMVAALRTNLSSALQQNSELRSRLSRIHDASDLAEISSVGNNSETQVARPFPQSLSYSSSCVSASEFFDAEEHEDELKPAEIIATDEAGVIELDGDSSSEAGSLSSEEGSGSSDNSDGATSAVIPAERAPLQNGAELKTSRRARLPCPRPTPASPSLWNLLYKNIGKDLSQISMPVTINEPLNMLQRLCEELEYSELLDSASECNNEIDRMALIAAFAVSAYAASAHRAASKPFNPLLAETYECIRPDKDFRFIAEQVSHHPPISACHAESPRWSFWQEARIKTKFWGKSMEFQPAGRVHVRLARTGDHYSWNKVTTCVHNLFGGQRWVDQYGDMHIVAHGTNIKCRLNFIKASSWSSGRHEVRGAVLAGSAARAQLAGRWSEGLSSGERALWRPGAMPPDYELYYGFTRFAMELNELEPGMRDVLPNTDTRLRPDQRALEEGDVDAAEQFKHQLEQAQRERRRDNQEHRAAWFRKTVEDGEETWVFTGEYWKAREAGFSEAPRLW